MAEIVQHLSAFKFFDVTNCNKKSSAVELW